MERQQGRAESVRLALTIGKIPFESEEIPRSEWPALKPQTPLGNLPTMTVDGKVVVQNEALLRFVGKLSGLYPADAWDALMVDQVSETVLEWTQTLFVYRGPDEDRLKEAARDAVDVAAPRYLGGVEKMLEGISDGPFVLGSHVSTADLLITTLYIFLATGILRFVDKHALDGYTRMKRCYDAVLQIPEVQEYHKKNPQYAPAD